MTRAANKASVVVLAIGEAPESESVGNINSLLLSNGQMQLFQAINATTTPLVTVLVEARPRILGPVAEGSAAVVMAYLPCVYGGPVVAEV